MPDKVYITKQDVQRLMRVLGLQRLAPAAMEVHSFEDLEPGMRKAPSGEPVTSNYGMDVFVNPGLEEGAFRLLPAPRFRICGRIAEWNVQQEGPVPAVLDVEMGSYNKPRMILDPGIIAKKEEPGDTPDPS